MTAEELLFKEASLLNQAAPNGFERQALPYNLGLFAGFNCRTPTALDHLVSAVAVVNWDHDRQSDAEFWPAGEVPEVALIFKHRSRVTAAELLDLDRVLVELGGDSRYNFLLIYSERRIIPSGTWECG